MNEPGVELLDTSAAGDAALVAQVARVINRAYALGEAGLWVEGATRIAPAEVEQAIRDGDVFVARLGDGVAGAAYLRPLDASSADLGLISADPDARGRGIGRALIHAAEELARSRGTTTMQLELLVPQGWVHPDKERLRAWYSRLGYRVVRTAQFEEIAAHLEPDLATPCEFLIFRKRL